MFFQAEGQIQILHGLGCSAFEKIVQHDHQAPLCRVSCVDGKATNMNIGRILDSTDLWNLPGYLNPGFTGVSLPENLLKLEMKTVIQLGLSRCHLRQMNLGSARSPLRQMAIHNSCNFINI